MSEAKRKTRAKKKSSRARKRLGRRMTKVVSARSSAALQREIDAVGEETVFGVAVECIYEPKKGAPWFMLRYRA